MTVSIALAVGVGILGIVDQARQLPEPSPIEPPSSEIPPARQAHDDEAAAPVKRTLELVCGVRAPDLGSAFGGLELGRVLDRAPTAPSIPGAKIELLSTGRRVDGVDVTIPNDPGWAGCYQFDKLLHQRWGRPTEATNGDETWRDADRVATFTQGFSDCTLQFSRVVSAEQWLNDTRSSRIPIWAIGHPVTELEAELGVPPGDNPRELRWQDESLGNRFSHVDMVATVERGRVVGVGTTVPFDDSVGDLLWQRLKTLYGRPDIIRAHEDTMHVRWRRPAIDVGKYWGQDGLVRQMFDERGRMLPAPPPRKPDADDGVVVGILFGR